jgi:NAD(P)H-hydrate epimerase
MEPFDAAALGVYAHGLAGEIAKRAVGEVSMVAGDVLESLPAALKQLSN